jgi:hypothetical protein
MMVDENKIISICVSVDQYSDPGKCENSYEDPEVTDEVLQNADTRVHWRGSI